MCFLPSKFSYYPSRPVQVPELFGKYSWEHLAVQYTEKLISRLFLDENPIFQSDNFFEIVSTPGLLLDGFFPALCHFCIGFHRFAKSQWAGKLVKLSA